MKSLALLIVACAVYSATLIACDRVKPPIRPPMPQTSASAPDAVPKPQADPAAR